MSGESQVPMLLDGSKPLAIPLSEQEKKFLSQAKKLFDAGFYDHALLDIWNASVSNLRRRVESYGVELFQSVVKDEPGRKKFNQSGETLSERWSDVDDIVLISGAARLGLLNKKAGKSLEMINWMRNHASPAHGSDHPVTKENVIGLVLMIQSDLFEQPMPDPGHSVSGLFDPIKSSVLTEEAVDLLKDQIAGLRLGDMRTTFGFMLDLLVGGEEPAISNVRILLPYLWQRCPEDTKRTAGLQYHQMRLDDNYDNEKGRAARVRLLELLIEVKGIQYIPDAARASIFRQAAKELAAAKDKSYGWSDEEAVAKKLKQLGPCVPQIAFVEVYQEILSVSCGNYHCTLQTYFCW